MFLIIKHHTTRELLTQIFPVIGNQYWFISAFILLTLLSPALRICLNNLSDKQLLKLLAAIEFILIISFISLHISANSSVSAVTDLFCLISFAICGYAVKRFEKWIDANWTKLRLACLGVIALYYVIFGVILVDKMPSMFIDVQSPLLPFVGTAVFLLFTRLHFTSRAVNWFSSAMFGVYLIHQCAPVRTLINPEFAKLLPSNLAAIPVSILLALGVILICALIEKARQFVVKTAVKIVKHD
jgi:hypothetical protein